MRYRSAQLRGLAHNPALPPDLLDRFVAEADGKLVLSLVQRDDLTAEHLRVLVTRAGESATAVLLARGLIDLAAVPTEDPWMGLMVAEQPGANPELVRALARHPEPLVRAALAERVSPSLRSASSSTARLPLDVLDLLAHDQAFSVVLAVARWQPISRELAEELRRQADDDIDHALVNNQSTPPEVLVSLVDHPSDLLRWQLASRPDLPHRVYEQLAKDHVPGVRYEVAANAATAESLLRELAAADPDRETRRQLAHNPVIPLDLLVSLAANTRIGPTLVARVDTATDAELRMLAASTTKQVRMLVAERPDLPIDLVHLLAADAETNVVKSIAPNLAITGERLRELVVKHGPRLYPRAARNPNCPPDLLHDMARDGELGRRAHVTIANHPNANADTLLLCLRDPIARRHAATHPNLPPDKIVELLDDPEVAEAAAANPSLPVRVMVELVGA
jgi:hypothetical protein